jgi:hypothetical protein
MDTAPPACASSRFSFPARDAAPSGEARLDASTVFANVGGLLEVAINLPRLGGLVVGFVAELARSQPGFGRFCSHGFELEG